MNPATPKAKRDAWAFPLPRPPLAQPLLPDATTRRRAQQVARATRAARLPCPQMTWEEAALAAGQGSREPASAPSGAGRLLCPSAILPLVLNAIWCYLVCWMDVRTFNITNERILLNHHQRTITTVCTG